VGKAEGVIVGETVGDNVGEEKVGDAVGDEVGDIVSGGSNVSSTYTKNPLFSNGIPKLGI